jgi:hypothetical protein
LVAYFARYAATRSAVSSPPIPPADHLHIDLLAEGQQARAILRDVSGRGEWLPWRRDWSKTPNAWKVYVAYSVLFAVIAAVYLAAGRLIGIFWLALAITWAVLTGFVRSRSRPGPQRRNGNDQAH